MPVCTPFITQWRAYTRTNRKPLHRPLNRIAHGRAQPSIWFERPKIIMMKTYSSPWRWLCWMICHENKSIFSLFGKQQFGWPSQTVMACAHITLQAISSHSSHPFIHFVSSSYPFQPSEIWWSENAPQGWLSFDSVPVVWCSLRATFDLFTSPAPADTYRSGFHSHAKKRVNNWWRFRIFHKYLPLTPVTLVSRTIVQRIERSSERTTYLALVWALLIQFLHLTHVRCD